MPFVLHNEIYSSYHSHPVSLSISFRSPPPMSSTALGRLRRLSSAVAASASESPITGWLSRTSSEEFAMHRDSGVRYVLPR